MAGDTMNTTSIPQEYPREQREVRETARQPGRAAFSGAAAPAGGGHEGVIHLRRAIAGLPHKQGQALVMRKFAGLEYEEIGAALECSADSARASVYQALKKLKAIR